MSKTRIKSEELEFGESLSDPDFGLKMRRSFFERF